MPGFLHTFVVTLAVLAGIVAAFAAWIVGLLAPAGALADRRRDALAVAWSLSYLLVTIAAVVAALSAVA